MQNKKGGEQKSGTKMSRTKGGGKTSRAKPSWHIQIVEHDSNLVIQFSGRCLRKCVDHIHDD